MELTRKFSNIWTARTDLSTMSTVSQPLYFPKSVSEKPKFNLILNALSPEETQNKSSQVYVPIYPNYVVATKFAHVMNGVTLWRYINAFAPTSPPFVGHRGYISCYVALDIKENNTAFDPKLMLDIHYELNEYVLRSKNIFISIR